ncbi:hypothetical protein GBA52_011761 [Prunus armeniaca]|nr:hypothetical protein GBA52_011761 [Prunus armeniaca]
MSDYGMSIITEKWFILMRSTCSAGKGEGTKSWNSTNMEGDVYNFGFILLESLVGPIYAAQVQATADADQRSDFLRPNL